MENALFLIKSKIDYPSDQARNLDLADIYDVLGEIHQSRGEYKQAQEKHEEALRLLETDESELRKAYSKMYLANALIGANTLIGTEDGYTPSEQQVKAAEDRYKDAKKIFEAQDIWPGVVRALIGLGIVCCVRLNWELIKNSQSVNDRAEEEFEQGKSHFEEIVRYFNDKIGSLGKNSSIPLHDLGGRLKAYVKLGNLNFLRKKYSDAEKCYQEVMSVLEDQRYKLSCDLLAEIYHGFGKVLREQNREDRVDSHDEIIDYFKKSLELYQKLGNSHLKKELLFDLVQAYLGKARYIIISTSQKSSESLAVANSYLDNALNYIKQLSNTNLGKDKAQALSKELVCVRKELGKQYLGEDMYVPLIHNQYTIFKIRANIPDRFVFVALGSLFIGLLSLSATAFFLKNSESSEPSIPDPFPLALKDFAVLINPSELLDPPSLEKTPSPIIIDSPNPVSNLRKLPDGDHSLILSDSFNNSTEVFLRKRDEDLLGWLNANNAEIQCVRFLNFSSPNSIQFHLLSSDNLPFINKWFIPQLPFEQLHLRNSSSMTVDEEKYLLYCVDVFAEADLYEAALNWDVEQGLNALDTLINSPDTCKASWARDLSTLLVDNGEEGYRRMNSLKFAYNQDYSCGFVLYPYPSDELAL